MTPKSLLRHKYCVSNLDDFNKSNFFHRVLEDHALIKNSKFIKIKKARTVRKRIICSGKIYFDLIEARDKNKVEDGIYVRIKELDPFQVKSLLNIIQP